MAAKQQQAGDVFTSHIAGMSKPQLYEVMSQMKVLIDQNHQQARQILIDNPLLTRTLFQAQIMLGMVQPPQAIPIVQQALSQSQSSLTGLSPNIQAAQSSPIQSGVQGQITAQSALPDKQQHPAQPSIPLPPVSSVPSLAFQPQNMANPPQAMQQVKAFSISQVPSMSLPQSSQIHNATLPPAPVPPQYSILPSHVPMISGQMQQPLQTPGMFNQQLQPPLPQQPRHLSMPPFQHQIHSQMPHTLGFQASSAPQQLLSHPMFHSAGNPSSTFPQGLPPLPNQPPPQQLYQGGPHIGADYSSQAGMSIQAERAAPWVPGLPEASTAGSQLLGPPSFFAGQMMQGMGSQPPRPRPLTPEMEKTLLQQVLNLTTEQINLLPPEQRQQVLQLQDMLR
ncbi:cleavage stimulating factor 64 isoform X1 [Typha latifolia]|uniref:cleavage stimulating factor 64 isoform X1 n=2 Tax=Typha latifolia TaxID=4733 RepID=UPI003C2ADA8F